MYPRPRLRHHPPRPQSRPHRRGHTQARYPTNRRSRGQPHLFSVKRRLNPRFFNTVRTTRHRPCPSRFSERCDARGKVAIRSAVEGIYHELSVSLVDVRRRRTRKTQDDREGRKSPLQNPFIFIVSPNPKPEQRIPSTSRQSTIAAIDAHRPKRADLLKPKRRVIRVRRKKRILLISLFLNVSRQSVVTLPELRQRVRTEAHFRLRRSRRPSSSEVTLPEAIA